MRAGDGAKREFFEAVLAGSHRRTLFGDAGAVEAAAEGRAEPFLII
jgi:hypothetical protein